MRINEKMRSADYKHFLKKIKPLLTESETEKLINSSLDEVIEITGGERGIIIVFDEEKEIMFQAARNLNREDIKHPRFEISRTIIDRVKSTNTPLYLKNALDDPTLRESDSVVNLKILSVICIPLTFEDKVFGVVYLDNRTIENVFKPEMYAVVHEFADFMSLAIHNTLERKKLRNHADALEEELRGRYMFDAIIGHHPKIVAILKLISQVSDTDATVLISGESGTGKELVAHALHFNSSRRNRPFVPINCGALPENLLESELFGHVKGAYTGAIQDKQGWFERADGGTIFLDEVSEMTQATQVKLLRILQNGEYSQVGSTEIRCCDVRVVAASSKDLKKLMKTGKFRKEVYYRLNVIDINLPPLRERRCDILLLAQHFMRIYGKKYMKKNLKLTKDAESSLSSYDFPGNVRELENLIQKAIILAQTPKIKLTYFPTILQSQPSSIKGSEYGTFREAKNAVVERFEREYIERILKQYDGNVRRAARNACMDVKNIYIKINKYNINTAQFKK